MSLPTRERGLKLLQLVEFGQRIIVAPYTGAWIETWREEVNKLSPRVAPYTGAWIET